MNRIALRVLGIVLALACCFAPHATAEQVEETPTLAAQAEESAAMAAVNSRRGPRLDGHRDRGRPDGSLAAAAVPTTTTTSRAS
jgi:hypothetical protein